VLVTNKGGSALRSAITAKINCKLCSHYEYLYSSVRGIWQKTGVVSIVFIESVSNFADSTTHGMAHHLLPTVGSFVFPLHHSCMSILKNVA
jgi:hypothetical protein